MYMYENFDFGLTKYRCEEENLDPVFDTKIDMFPNIADPNVNGSISLFDLLTKIRYNLFDGDLPFETLLTDKYVDDRINPAYNKIKMSLPTVCYNANFKGYKDLKHLKAPTNLMFLDIDGFKSKEEAMAYKSQITSKYDWIIACNLS